MKHVSEVINQPSLITHLTGASNYTWVHFNNGTNLLLSKSLASFEGLLPSFVRVHKTALVNPRHVHAVQSPPRSKASGAVSIKGGIVLPVSRRRWNEVAGALQQHIQPGKAPVARIARPEKVDGKLNQEVAKREARLTTPTIYSTDRQVFAVIKDVAKGVLLQQLLAEKWPNCAVRFFANSAALTDHVAHAGLRELPALIMLDIRTADWAGLSALEHIKTDKRLRLIPTVLFVSGSTGNTVEVCYAAGANSVVTHPADNAEFLRTAERICQYWLTFAALPATQHVRPD